MEIIFYGHACFSVNYNGKLLLFDPFISGNDLAKGINVDEIQADYILLSHGHQDHILDAENIAKRTGAKIISIYEIVQHYGAKGIEGHPMNPGGKWDFDFGTVKMVSAVHSSSYPDGNYAGVAAGFVISGGDKNFYFAGDTALNMDMKLIPLTCPKLDFAILPIGDNFTMGYEDALIAADFIECNQIIACHYDTFGYIKVDHDKVQKAFESAGKSIKFLEIAKTENL